MEAIKVKELASALKNEAQRDLMLIAAFKEAWESFSLPKNAGLPRKAHAACCAKILAALIAEGIEAEAAARAVFLSPLQNSSQLRQKLEKESFFSPSGFSIPGME